VGRLTLLNDEARLDSYVSLEYVVVGSELGGHLQNIAILRLKKTHARLIAIKFSHQVDLVHSVHLSLKIKDIKIQF